MSDAELQSLTKQRRDYLRRMPVGFLSPYLFYQVLDEADAIEAERDSLAAKITAVEALAKRSEEWYAPARLTISSREIRAALSGAE